MRQLLSPAETAYRRKVLFAVEVLDGVTMGRITQGIVVRASGMRAAPVVNFSGVFVWLDEGQPLLAQQITVDPGLLPYVGTSARAPLPPERLVRIALAPGRGYAFQAGTTALRLSLIDSDLDVPVVPAADTDVFLRWFDAGVWRDAAVRSRTNAGGDASVVLRFGRNDEPGKNPDGTLQLRLCASRAGVVTRSADFSLPEGRVTDRTVPFALNRFLP